MIRTVPVPYRAKAPMGLAVSLVRCLDIKLWIPFKGMGECYMTTAPKMHLRRESRAFLGRLIKGKSEVCWEDGELYERRLK